LREKTIYGYAYVPQAIDVVDIAGIVESGEFLNTIDVTKWACRCIKITVSET